MQMQIVDDYAALSRAGADLVAEVVANKPDAAIVLATGETPIGVYRELVERYQRGTFDPSRLRVFQLDAYLGLVPDDQRSLFRWMDEMLLAPLHIALEQVTRLPGTTDDPAETCRAYDAAVQAAGGFDLAVLGLGPNGHIGFNEPPSPPDAPSRVVALTASSIASNARYWGGAERVPTHALTCGTAQLLGARQTLLLVAGAHKHTIVHRAVEGPVTPDVPASYLQTRANVAVLADRAAWEGAGTTEKRA